MTAASSGLAHWRREAAATLRLGLPLVGAQVAQVAIATTDVLMVGRLGPETLAASSLGANLFFLLQFACIGIAAASAPMLAHALGRRPHRARREEVRRIVRAGLAGSLLAALPAMAALWQTGAILRLAGQDPGLAAAAETYLRCMLWGLLPSVWFVVLRSFVAARQRAAPVFVISAVGVALNALLDWLFVFGSWGAPALGLPGAGVASAAVNLAMTAALFALVLGTPRFAAWRPLGGRGVDLARLAELFRLGLPISGIVVLEVGFFSAASLVIGRIGTLELAAHTIALQCAAITFMVPYGLSQAATVRVGLAAGRGDTAAARRAGWTALGFGWAFMSVAALAFWLIPETIAGAFLEKGGKDEPAVLRLAVGFLAVAALFQLFDAAQAIGAGALRGLKDTRVPMLLAFCGYWVVGFPAGAALGLATPLGGVGVWLGFVVGLAATAALLLRRFARLLACPSPAKPG